MILAIDPGNMESAYVVLDEHLKPVELAKIDNKTILDDLNMDRFQHRHNFDIEHCAIEMVACYGMPVGAEVFDTCVWIGRFLENANFQNIQLIYRKDEKMNLCGNMRAKDSNVIQALIDRFAYGVPNKGKGTKKSPGWFYGFSKDIWQSYAVGVTYHDMYIARSYSAK